MSESKFAEITDLDKPDYMAINKALQAINIQYQLPDHSELNKQRFPNETRVLTNGTFYGARMWEYPFAILKGDLKPGMQIADIGCGSTPFTVYLSTIAGANNVTGFDNDFLENEDTHYAFGIRKKFKEETGIRFKFSNIDQLDAADDSFDVVYCISVLEHIENPAIWQKGLMEMARIVKPGGKLILTFDFSITTKFISIGDVLNYTGLIPDAPLKMNWPEKRFVNVDGVAMDVFGMSLVKPQGSIQEDSSAATKIRADWPFKNYIPAATDASQLQIQKDLKRGKLITLFKLLLNKYK